MLITRNISSKGKKVNFNLIFFTRHHHHRHRHIIIHFHLFAQQSISTNNKNSARTKDQKASECDEE